MKSSQPKLGTTIRIDLPDGRVAYGRVLRDASVAFYRPVKAEQPPPPTGDRAHAFVVGVYDTVFQRPEVASVGIDPALDEADQWPPPYRVDDPITGQVRIYERGTLRVAVGAEADGLEPAAVWDFDHLVRRLIDQ